jgi:hypothetical protein
MVGDGCGFDNRVAITQEHLLHEQVECVILVNNLLVFHPCFPCRSVAQALEVIPRTLIQNCGANVIRTLTKLRVCAGGLYGRMGSLVAFYCRLTG